MIERFMQEAIRMAVLNVQEGRGGPFAALVVRDGVILARGTNLVTATNDPTAHAEVVAIRKACEALGDFQLTGCDLFTTCEPCPMCLGAIYWARPARVFYGSSREEAARAGFDDAFIYAEVCRAPAQRRVPMHRLLPEAARQPFDAWLAQEGRVEY